MRLAENRLKRSHAHGRRQVDPDSQDRGGFCSLRLLGWGRGHDMTKWRVNSAQSHLTASRSAFGDPDHRTAAEGTGEAVALPGGVPCAESAHWLPGGGR